VYFGVIIDGTGTKQYATPARYEHAVLTQLRRIHHSKTGRALFREFRAHHTLQIIPFEERDPHDQLIFNAYAIAKDPQHATRAGQPERSGSNGQVLPDALGNPVIGDGTGSDSDIKFTPGMFTRFCRHQKARRLPRSGAQPDEVLFHEMVHSTREMLGIFDPLPFRFGYDTEEEFFAILLANIYASETGRPIDLREDHHGFDHLWADTDAKFIPNPSDPFYRLIAKLVTQQPVMALEIGKINCRFNPIRRYFQMEHDQHGLA
jgi:hypothetical protein